MRTKALSAAVSASLLLAAGAAQAGSIFVTGHDSDEHDNSQYMAAGLDYLLFGTASNAAGRAGKNIAYIQTDLGAPPSGIAAAGYAVTGFDSSNFAGAFTGFDAIMVGSGGGTADRNALFAAAASFTTYFNAGGAIYINTDEGFGQSWYDFVPSFGTAANNTISTSGAFNPTAAGLAIGLTDAIVDADVTHSFYRGVDTNTFTVFEVTDPAVFPANDANLPVAFGLRGGTIGGGGFQTCGQPGQPACPTPLPGILPLIGMGVMGLLGALGIRRKHRQ